MVDGLDSAGKSRALPVFLDNRGVRTGVNIDFGDFEVRYHGAVLQNWRIL